MTDFASGAARPAALHSSAPASASAPGRAARHLAVALCVLLPLQASAGAVVLWTGTGGTPAWSTTANWSPARAPADGDSVVFGGTPPGAANTVDLSLRLDSLSFAATAGAFRVGVAGDGGRVLTFDGAGIQNLTSGTGPIRQSLRAEAGSTGGGIVFAGASGINLGTGPSFRAVDLSALGGASAGQVGGRIVFQDTSSTGDTTFNALRAEGAAAAGAGAGQLVFRDSATVTRSTTLVLGGGTGLGAAGGQASFADGVQVDAIVTLLSGTAGGQGGRAVFSGAAVAGLRATLNQQGGNAATGSEGVTTFAGTARLTGTGVNSAGTTAGASGGRIEFREGSRFDSTGYDGSLGTVQILNQGGSVTGAGGGSVVFRDDSFARGSFLEIVNGAGSESTDSGTLGGRTRFTDRARAGDLSIVNQAGRGAGAAGKTSFEDASNAERARIVQAGGTAATFGGSRVAFIDTASAGAARIDNQGGQVAGSGGGTALFQNTANAGTATITNGIGEVAGAGGGETRFAGGSGAGSARIVNEARLSAVGGGRGSTIFVDASSAQNARIDNQGGQDLVNGFTVFFQTSSAGNAVITNFGGRAAGAGGGRTDFTEDATAGAATLVMAAGTVAGAEGGRTTYFGNATAGSATQTLRGAAAVGASGGRVLFTNSSSAGRSTLRVEGSQADNIGGPEAANVTFSGTATAGDASVVIGGNRFAFGSVGRVDFTDASTAGDATFSTLAGLNAGGRLTFQGSPLTTAGAGNARITNGSNAVASGRTDDFGGGTLFLARSSADRASIVNEAGATAFGAQTVFSADATAADARIVNAGGRAGDRGGITFFQDASTAARAIVTNLRGAVNAEGLSFFKDTATAASATITSQGATAAGQVGGRTAFTDRSTAGNATLVAEGGSGGGAGGRITFDRQASGAAARIVLGAGSSATSGGTLDISGVDVWLQASSIEGGGQVALGARSLILTGGAPTVFSGVIRGSTPPAFPSLSVLGGQLTLTGANEYAGRTQVGDGLTPGSGKLVVANTTGSATGSGEVLVLRGGTLGGSGFISGAVTLSAGGTIAPGDPVTLTLRDSLTWDGDGVIRLVLGADSAGSDHLNVGSLIRGADGVFAFDFIDAGITDGTEYDLIGFGTLVGFVATDFVARGRAGTFSIDGDSLGFTAARVAVVPEPPSWALFGIGFALLGWVGCWRNARSATCRRGRFTP